MPFTYDLEQMKLAVESSITPIPADALTSFESFDNWLNEGTMHPRINELIKQSYEDVPHERDWDTTSRVFNKVKFAELIIHECVKVMEDEDEFYGEWLGEVIKHHFGIEQ